MKKVDCDKLSHSEIVIMLNVGRRPLWLYRANLEGADLKDSDLIGANMEEVVLKHSNLIGANLSGANLKNADLTNAVLKGANISGADLTGAILKGCNMKGIKYTAYTVWPTEFRPDENGAVLRNTH